MEYEKNPDGTDKLDEQGNPIPVKTSDEKEQESAKEKENLVQEIKDLRLKLGVTEKLLKDKEEKPEIIEPNKPLSEDEKISKAVENALKAKEALNAKANKKAAFEKFVTENKEFHPENDPTGLKKDALEKKLNQFNTDGLTTIEEFTSVIRDAKTLLLGTTTIDTSKENNNPYSEPKIPPKIPDGKNNTDLTPKELKLAQQTGKTKEQILHLREKYPDFLREILEQVRD